MPLLKRRWHRLERRAGRLENGAVTPKERAIIEQLDGILRSEKVRRTIEAVVAQVRADLARRPGAVMAWEPIPLALYGEMLPPQIESSWVFILRAGVNTGAERHPNSHQRMTTFEGVGDLQVRPDLNSLWESHVLRNDPNAPLEQRWVSIPVNTWHQPVVAPEADWVVVSFHTVAAEELIEQRPDPASPGGTKQMVYLQNE